MSRTPAWRSLVGAWASGDGVRNGKRDMSNIQDPEEEEILIKKRNQVFHRTHLKLVGKLKDEPSEQVVSLKGPAAHNVNAHVDIKAVEIMNNDSVEKGRKETVVAPSSKNSSPPKSVASRQKPKMN